MKVIKKIKSHRLRGKVSKHISHNGLLIRINKNLLQLNNKNYCKYWTKDLNKHFTKEEIQMANQSTQNNGQHQESLLECKLKPLQDPIAYLLE